eukprot:tig00000219_g19480.t1
MCSIHDLPDAVLLHVFSYLQRPAGKRLVGCDALAPLPLPDVVPLQQLVAIDSVCRRFRAVVAAGGLHTTLRVKDVGANPYARDAVCRLVQRHAVHVVKLTVDASALESYELGGGTLQGLLDMMPNLRQLKASGLRTLSGALQHARLERLCVAFRDASGLHGSLDLRAPALRSLRVTCFASESSHQPANGAYLQRAIQSCSGIEHLGLINPTQSPVLEALPIVCPNLKSLSIAQMPSWPILDRLLRRLPKLEALDLGSLQLTYYDPGPEFPRVLAEAARPLRALALPQLAPDVVLQAVAARHGATLEVLSLRDAEILGPASWRLLGTAFPALKALSIARLGPQQAPGLQSALAAPAFGPRLRALALPRNALPLHALYRLASAPCLPRLRFLSLRASEALDEVTLAAILARAPALARLDLSACPRLPAAAAVQATSAHAALRELKVTAPPAGAGGAGWAEVAGPAAARGLLVTGTRRLEIAVVRF